ncbi:hypothetical protein GCM10008937_07370 [Deinococcus depolymerans]|uniref:Uncharacterized protein n=1 Tax=Deinococcus depolymerans TaxID=392408 RepID=A0ABN1BR92_9DEIO
MDWVQYGSSLHGRSCGTPWPFRVGASPGAVGVRSAFAAATQEREVRHDAVPAGSSGADHSNGDWAGFHTPLVR